MSSRRVLNSNSFSGIQASALFLMNEASNTDPIVDATGNGHNGVFVNSPVVQQAGRNGGNSVQLTLAGGHLKFIGDVFSAGLSATEDGDWGYYYWAKIPTASTGTMYITKRGADAEWQSKQNGAVGSEMYNRNAFTIRISLNKPVTTLKDDQWHLYGMMYRKSESKVVVFRDTTIQEALFSASTGGTWQNIALTTAPLFIGSDRGTANFNTDAFIDELGIFKGFTLTNEQIVALANDELNIV